MQDHWLTAVGVGAAARGRLRRASPAWAGWDGGGMEAPPADSQPFEEQRYTQVIGRLQNELGIKSFNVAWMQSQAMTPNQALALAGGQAPHLVHPA